MKLVQTKTFRIRKTTAYLLVIFILGSVLVTGAINSYARSAKGPSPDSVSVEYYEGMELIQFQPAPENSQNAVISTSEGELKAVLYSDITPEAVKRFSEEANSGSYNGKNLTIYEYGSIFTLDSDSDEPYTAELSKDLWPFRGALCMTDKGDIVFVNAVPLSDSDKEYLLSDETVLKDVSKAFAETGGVPNYSRVYAVFGQVTDGMDVIERIASVTSEDTVTIHSISIEY